ncbi:MAG: hypothetical protein AAGJ93_03285 [Bacteroidota bacterium]
MIKQRILLVMICCFFASSWAIAQRGGAKGNTSIMTEETKTALNLTDEQRVEIEALQIETAEAMEAARQGRDRDAMKEAKQTERERLQEILNDDQMATLRSMRSENRADRSLEMAGEKPTRERTRPAGDERVHPQKGENTRSRDINREDRASLQAEIKAYRAENVTPIMTAQRQKLDVAMSADDRSRVAALRKELSASGNLENASENKEVVTLVNRYDEQISSLLMEVSANKLQWKADQDAIRAKYKGQAVEGDRRNEGREGRPAMTSDMDEKVRFLLSRTVPSKR